MPLGCGAAAACENVRIGPGQCKEFCDTTSAFRFERNGKRLCGQATNWVPDDRFPDSVDKERYQPVEATGRGEARGVVPWPGWSVAEEALVVSVENDEGSVVSGWRMGWGAPRPRPARATAPSPPNRTAAPGPR